jgi:hypothetical protein
MVNSAAMHAEVRRRTQGQQLQLTSLHVGTIARRLRIESPAADVWAINTRSSYRWDCKPKTFSLSFLSRVEKIEGEKKVN